MALASLCSQLQSRPNGPVQARFRAFVVDHGVRATSKDEASSVAKILESKSDPAHPLSSFSNISGTNTFQIYQHRFSKSNGQPTSTLNPHPNSSPWPAPTDSKLSAVDAVTTISSLSSSLTIKMIKQKPSLCVLSMAMENVG